MPVVHEHVLDPRSEVVGEGHCRCSVTDRSDVDPSLDAARPSALAVDGLGVEVGEDHGGRQGRAQRHEGPDRPVWVVGDRHVAQQRAERVGDEDRGVVADEALDATSELGAQIRVVGDDVDQVDRAVEGGAVRRLGQGLHGRAIGEAAHGLGDAGSRLLELGIACRAWLAPEQVAVEAEGDIVIRDLFAVVPEAITERRQPAGLELVGSPQLVERSMHHHDLCHVRPSRRARPYRYRSAAGHEECTARPSPGSARDQDPPSMDRIAARSAWPGCPRSTPSGSSTWSSLVVSVDKVPVRTDRSTT